MDGPATGIGSGSGHDRRGLGLGGFEDAASLLDEQVCLSLALSGVVVGLRTGRPGSGVGSEPPMSDSSVRPALLDVRGPSGNGWPADSPPRYG